MSNKGLVLHPSPYKDRKTTTVYLWSVLLEASMEWAHKRRMSRSELINRLLEAHLIKEGVLPADSTESNAG